MPQVDAVLERVETGPETVLHMRGKARKRARKGDAQVYIARRIKPLNARALRKRADEKAAQDARKDPSRKTATAKHRRVRQLSIAVAKESVCSLTDNARDPILFRTGSDTPAVNRKTNIFDSDLAKCPRYYRVSVALTVRHYFFRLLDQCHSWSSMQYIGRRSEARVVHTFGDKACLHYLLTKAATVAGVDYSEVAKCVLPSSVYLVGFSVIFFDTAVE